MPKSSPKSKRKAIAVSSTARNILLVAAQRLFAERGLTGTSIRDIAEVANMNSSQISYYFESKEGLYRACVQNIAEERIQISKQILFIPESKEEFRVRLKLFVENFFSYFIENREIGLIIIREFDRTQSPAAKIFKAYFTQLYDLLIQFFFAAIEKKFLRVNDRSTDELTITSLFFGLLMSELRFDHIKEDLFKRTIKSPDERKMVIQHIVDLFC